MGVLQEPQSDWLPGGGRSFVTGVFVQGACVTLE